MPSVPLEDAFFGCPCYLEKKKKRHNKVDSEGKVSDSHHSCCSSFTPQWLSPLQALSLEQAINKSQGRKCTYTAQREHGIQARHGTVVAAYSVPALTFTNCLTTTLLPRLRSRMKGRWSRREPVSLSGERLLMKVGFDRLVSMCSVVPCVRRGCSAPFSVWLTIPVLSLGVQDDLLKPELWVGRHWPQVIAWVWLWWPAPGVLLC